MSSPIEAADPADLPRLRGDNRPDPQVTYLLDGVPFGDYDDHGSHWVVLRTEGWKGGARRRTSRVDRAWGDGSIRGPSWAQERLITLEGHTLTPTVGARIAAEDRLADLCGDGGRLYPLEVTDQLGRTRTADVELDDDGVQVKSVKETELEWVVRLAAPDPRKHGAWQRVIVEADAEPFGGIDTRYGIDTTGGLYMGSLVPPRAAQVANYGSATAHPLFRLVGPRPRPHIANVERAETITYGDDLAPGETLVVNCDAYAQGGVPGYGCVSSLRGNVRSLVQRRGDWPSVQPREVATFRVSGGGTPGVSEVLVELRPAWR